MRSGGVILTKTGDVDKRSKVVREGQIKAKEGSPDNSDNVIFKADGHIDGRCKGLKSGSVRVTKSGEIDKRSHVIRAGFVKV